MSEDLEQKAAEVNINRFCVPCGSLRRKQRGTTAEEMKKEMLRKKTRLSVSAYLLNNHFVNVLQRDVGDSLRIIRARR